LKKIEEQQERLIEDEVENMVNEGNRGKKES